MEELKNYLSKRVGELHYDLDRLKELCNKHGLIIEERQMLYARIDELMRLMREIDALL